MKKMLQVIGCLALVLSIFASNIQFGSASQKSLGVVDTNGVPSAGSGVWIEKDGKKYYVFCIDPDKAYPSTGVQYEQSTTMPEGLSSETIAIIERILTVLSPLNSYGVLKNDNMNPYATQHIIWGYIADKDKEQNLEYYDALKLNDGYTVEEVRDYIENGTPLVEAPIINDIVLNYDEDAKAYIGTTDYVCGHATSHEPIFDLTKLPEGMSVNYNQETNKVEVTYIGNDVEVINNVEISYQSESYNVAESTSLFIPLPVEQQPEGLNKIGKEYQRMFGYEIQTKVLTDVFKVQAIQREEPVVETIDVVIEKVWQDADDTKRPESIYVDLLSDGVVVDTYTLSQDNNWTLTVQGLNKYQDDQETLVQYEVREHDVDGYELVDSDSELVDGVLTLTLVNQIVEDDVLGDKEEPVQDKEEPVQDNKEPTKQPEEVVEDEVLGDVEVPDTGDSIPLELCIAAVVVSGIVIVYLVIKRKKDK